MLALLAFRFGRAGRLTLTGLVLLAGVPAGPVHAEEPPQAVQIGLPQNLFRDVTKVTLEANVNPGNKKVLAYIQGKNANGDWGVTQAVWIPAK